jgi:hypothetical protein
VRTTSDIRGPDRALLEQCLGHDAPPVALYCLNSSTCEGRPLSFHTDSLSRVPFALSLSEVPPTATTDAGVSGLAGAAKPSLTTSQS